LVLSIVLEHISFLVRRALFSIFLLFFFLLLRPPPISTLFPYTTLFRSCAQRKNKPCMLFQIQSYQLLVYDLLEVGQHISLLRSADRKSTRLNSSHRTISYAVFCLKKKKKKQKQTKISEIIKIKVIMN